MHTTLIRQFEYPGLQRIDATLQSISVTTNGQCGQHMVLALELELIGMSTAVIRDQLSALEILKADQQPSF